MGGEKRIKRLAQIFIKFTILCLFCHGRLDTRRGRQEGRQRQRQTKNLFSTSSQLWRQKGGQKDKRRQTDSTGQRLHFMNKRERTSSSGTNHIHHKLTTMIITQCHRCQGYRVILELFSLCTAIYCVSHRRAQKHVPC